MISHEKRIMGSYGFGSLGKEYSFNFISIYELRNSSLHFLSKYPIKTGFFCMVGLLLETVLCLYGKNSFYFLGMILFSILLELTTMFTSALFPIPLDIDNWLSYLIGIILGFLVWSLLQKTAVKLLNKRGFLSI